MSVTFADVAPKLLTIEQAREKLSYNEGLSSIDFTLSSDSISFDFDEDWELGVKQLLPSDVVPVYININGIRRQLTKEAFTAACSATGLPAAYIYKTPGELLKPQLNYWFSKSGIMSSDDMRLLANDEVGQAFIRQAYEPFSNFELLDNVLEGVKDVYGSNDDVMVDFKFYHTLRDTHLRLVIPAHTREMGSLTASKTGADTWCAGIALQNSVIGDPFFPLQEEGYLFRYFCANGMSTLHSTSGRLRRSKRTTVDEGYNWARDTAVNILSGLEAEFDTVDALTRVDLTGTLGDQLLDVFERVSVPRGARENVVEEAIDADDASAYGILNAITAAANYQDVPESVRRKLIECGGKVSHLFSEHSCPTCHRV